MPKVTENFVHLENPDYNSSDFRMKPGTKGTINIVGSSTFGNGIVARYGLLKKSGASAIFTYLFPTSKFDMATAQEWLSNHKKQVNKEDLINKDFSMVVTLQKAYEDADGRYFLKGEASNTELDLQDDQMSNEAIDELKEQSIGKTAFLNHKYDIGKNDFGVIKGYEKSDNKFIPVIEVFSDMKKMIKERIDKGAKFGLSIGGKIRDAVKDGNKRVIKSVIFREVSLTYFPANWKTLGTVSAVKDNPCLGGVCKQIFKSVDMYEGGYGVVNPVEFYLTKDLNIEPTLDIIKGDDNVGETIKIPDDVNLDKEVVDKLDASKEDGKVVGFVKTLLGIKEKEYRLDIFKASEEELQAACAEGDDGACAMLEKMTAIKKEITDKLEKEDVNKDDGGDELTKEEIDGIIKKNDELEQRVHKMETTMKEVTNENETIKKEKATIEHENIVKEAIKSYDVLKEDVKDEDALKEKLVKDEGFTSEEVEKDLDNCLKTVIMANERAAGKIKKHDIPSKANPLFNKEVNEYQARADKMKKALENQGRITVKD
ncbi:MAG: hypothetical protein QHH15_00275 [Candidatus Thermoplasmatota archaeon]|nr:hypothetical protein [Candidatus Thermoplasmatota archaeon]